MRKWAYFVDMYGTGNWVDVTDDQGLIDAYEAGGFYLQTIEYRDPVPLSYDPGPVTPSPYASRIKMKPLLIGLSLVALLVYLYL